MCGIFGLLAACHAHALALGCTLDEALVILERLVAVTAMRGGQSLGVACTTWGERGNTPTVHVKKHVVGKRERPMTATRKILDSSETGDLLAHAPRNYLGHSRFATASRNQVKESHPHAWIPPRAETVWRVENGLFKQARAIVGINIAHNGDFDGIHLWEASAGNAALGLWLERVLDAPNDLRGDSPKIAGYLELVVVQGRWAAAARLAYQRSIASSMADASGGHAHLTKQSPNTAPRAARCAEWGDFFQELFVRHDACRLPALPEQEQPAFVQRFKDVCVAALADRAKREQLGMGAWSEEATGVFVSVAVDSFLHNDLFSGMEAFLSRAEGSFAIAACYTLEEGAVVLASRGQPLSLALDPELPIVCYGSESHAVTSQVGTYENVPFALRFKLDLDDCGGEVVRVGKPGTGFGVAALSASKHSVEALKPGGATDGSAAAVVADPRTQQGKDGGRGMREIEVLSDFVPGIQVISHLMSSKEGAVPPERLRERLREHGRVSDYRRGGSEIVAEDIRSIPRLVNKINLEWSMLQSANCQTAAEFYRALARTAKANRGHFGSVDLLVVGIESSLWIGEQFGADVRKAFKGELNVLVASANKVLGSSATTAREVHFCGFNRLTVEDLRRDRPVVLCISQSGQTFGTLHAIELLLDIVPDSLFALLGDTDTTIERTMARALGREAVRTRIMTNLSGLRPAEAATAATVAMHHTLSHLLLSLVRRARTGPGIGGVAGARARAATNLDPLEEGSDTSDDEADSPSKVSGGVTALGAGEKRGRKAPRQATAAGEANLQERLRDAAKFDTTLPSGSGHGALALVLAGARDAEAVAAAAAAAAAANEPSLETTLGVGDVQGLQHIVNSLQYHVELTCGADVGGNDNDSPLHARLVQQGKAWAKHITEPWRALVITGAYVILTVLFQCPIVDAFARLVLGKEGANINPIWHGDIWTMHWPTAVGGAFLVLLGFVLRLCDGLIYVFMPKLAAWTMRWWEGRQMRARMGKRTIVVADVPYVHQLVEMFVSKCYALSFGFDSVDVHGTSANDHFVHRYTHRVARGVLIAVGRPDGRICSLLKLEKTVLLALKQAAFVENRGVGPEIVTLGHNPYTGTLPVRNHVALTSLGRRKFLCEHLYDSIHNQQGDGERDVAELFDVSKHPELEHEFNALLAHKPLGMHHLPDSIGSVRNAKRAAGGGSGSSGGGMRAAAASAGAAAADAAAAAHQAGILTGSLHGSMHGSMHGSGHGFNAVESIPEERLERPDVERAASNLGKLRPEGPTVSPNDDAAQSDEATDVSGVAALISRLRPGAGAVVGGSAGGNNDETVRRYARGGGPAAAVHDGHRLDGSMTMSGSRIGQLAAAAAHGIMDASRTGARAVAAAVLGRHRGNKAYEAAETLHHSLEVRQAFQSKLSDELCAVQDHQILLEHLAESRVLSLERYVAFLVMFHAMADASSAPWLWGRWEVGRSQSTLRVATTASPVCVEPPELPDYEQDRDAIARESVQWARMLHKEYEGLSSRSA